MHESIVFIVSFHSWHLDCFPYSARPLFTEVSWLFSPSPSPQSSHAGSVLCLTRLAGWPFSPAASADLSVTVSMEMCIQSLNLLLASQRERMHILSA